MRIAENGEMIGVKRRSLRLLNCSRAEANVEAAGLALIEGLWNSGCPLADAVVPAITSQIVYLLLETQSGDTRHQRLNFTRAMNLILKAPVAPQFHVYYCEIADALHRLRDGEELQGKGVPISPQAAKIWLKKLGDRTGNRLE